MKAGILRRVRSRIARLVCNQTFETFFNVPMKFDEHGLRAVNERLVEWAFCLGELSPLAAPLRILDFGCTRSWLPLGLAAFGHEVTGVDLRDFPFKQSRFHFHRANILDFVAAEPYDVILALSTLEHVGLDAYNAGIRNDHVDAVLLKIHALLRPDGRFVLTLPVGRKSVDAFERSFLPTEIKDLVVQSGFRLSTERYFVRTHGRDWSPVTEEAMSTVPNDVDARKLAGSGVNGLGCFVFKA